MPVPATAVATNVVVAARTLNFQTHAPIGFTDITETVAEAVRAMGLRDGIVTVFSRHTTAAIRIQENEPLLLQDLTDFLERVAPRDHPYGHNDFRVRTEHMHDDESPNGHAHCAHLLMGASGTVPVQGGELLLGTWQRVFLVEMDGPRHRREVVVHVLGSGA